MGTDAIQARSVLARCGCRLKTKIKFPSKVRHLFGLPRKFGLTHGEVKPSFLVRPCFGLIRRASLRINHDFIMSFKIAQQTIHFHKSYLDRVPKRYMPVYSGTADFVDVQVTLNVRRNLQASKYYWIFTFLGRTFVFWSEHFDTMYLSEFNQVCSAYVSSFYHQLENADKKCNVLTQKSFG